MPTVRQYQPQTSSQVVSSPSASAPVPSTALTSARGASMSMAGFAAAPAARSIPTSGPMRNPLPMDSFGVAPINPGATAQGFANLAGGIGNLAKAVQSFQARVDTTAAEEALVRFEREKNQMFFNSENGYFNTQGKQAYDQSKTVAESLVELQKKYADEFESDQARDMFLDASEAQLTAAHREIMRHASSGFDAWEAATLNARVENTLENAALYWNNPSQRAVQLELGRQSVIDSAIIQGLGPEAIAESLQTYSSKFAMATIDAALQSSSAAGQQALAENKSLLEGPDLVKVQYNIDRALVAERSQATADAAVNNATALVSQYGEFPNARQLIMEQVNQIPDEDLRNQTMRESQYQLDVKQRADSEARAGVFEAGEKFIAGGGSVNQFIASNPQGWTSLTSEQQRKLRSGNAVSTDYRVLSRLLNLPQAELAKIDPSRYAHQLAESDRRYLESQVREAITGSPEGQVGRTRAQETNSVITRIFGDDNNWNGDTRAQVDAFYAMITAETAFRTEQKNAPLSSSEFSELLNDMTRKAAIDRTFWFGTRDVDISDVPAAEIQPISQILREAGITVTGDNILNLFNQRQQLREAGQLPPIQ